MKHRAFLVGILLWTAALAQTTRPAHDPKVWEDEIKKFEAADKKKMPPEGAVLFVGSSSIRFWKTAQAFPNVATINRGFGGSFGSDSVYYFDRIVLPYKPRMIVFYGGENDIAGGVSAEDAAKGILDFTSLVEKKLPDTKLIIIGMKPSILRWKLIGPIRKGNSIVRAAVDGKPNVTYVDVEHVILGEDGKPKKELFRPDGLHLNDKGYEIWNRLLSDYVKPPQ